MTASVETLSSSPTTVKALTSARGVEAWHVESDVVPLISVSFIFEGGSAHDPETKPGVAQMMARLLDEGAGE
ncbi:MAG TPA: insulinase family protein, partial [Microvirga sp.]|nr:insulinase family protein [Microvirga sp.]